LRILVGQTPHRKPFRYRIEPSAAQRLATRDAPKRKQSATQRAKARDRDARVIRAARVESATRAKQRAEQALVRGEQKE